MADQKNKIKRVALHSVNNYNRENNCTCQNKIEEIRDVVEREVKVLQGQLQIAIEALAEQKVILKQLLRQNVEQTPISLKFPITSENKLIEINNDMTPDNRDLYVKTLRSLLQPAGVLKNLKNIISEEITADYNIEGVHGKKALKSMENFYSALLDSIPINENCKGSAETQLRKAIQLQKKRHFKKLSNSRIE